MSSFLQQILQLNESDNGSTLSVEDIQDITEVFRSTAREAVGERIDIRVKHVKGQRYDNFSFEMPSVESAQEVVSDLVVFETITDEFKIISVKNFGKTVAVSIDAGDDIAEAVARKEVDWDEADRVLSDWAGDLLGLEAEFQTTFNDKGNKIEVIFDFMDEDDAEDFLFAMKNTWENTDDVNFKVMSSKIQDGTAVIVKLSKYVPKRGVSEALSQGAIRDAKTDVSHAVKSILKYEPKSIEATETAHGVDIEVSVLSGADARALAAKLKTKRDIAGLQVKSAKAQSIYVTVKLVGKDL